jgi:hypothetical protein
MGMRIDNIFSTLSCHGEPSVLVFSHLNDLVIAAVALDVYPDLIYTFCDFVRHFT